MRTFLRLFRAGLDEVCDRSAALIRFLAPPAGWLLRRIAWLGLWVIEFPILVIQGLGIVVSETLRWLGHRAQALSRVLHPATAVPIVIVCAAALLAVSQFDDYRGEAIGAYQQPGAAPVGVDPPYTDRRTPIDVHSVALLVVAGGALLSVAVAVLGRRWRLGRIVSLLGITGVAVVLAVDLRQGLDTVREVVPYTDTEATLLGPFWVELTAAATLALCGVLLSAYMRPGAEASEQRRTERQKGSRRGSRRRGTAGLAEGRQ